MAFDVVSSEQLRHNPLNEVTGGIDRVTDQAGRTLVRKRLCPPPPAVAAPAGTASTASTPWSASADPRHWNYWRREAEAYRSAELRSSLERAGLDMPAGTVEEQPGGVTLWLEDVAGTPGTRFSLAEHTALAQAAGRWQAQGPLHAAWTSRRYLRDYSTNWPVSWHLLDDDDAWQRPLIKDNWPPGLRADWQRLVAHREFLLDLMERLPRTRSHLDFWVCNQIMRPTGQVVLVDWAFAGDGAVGEDIGNHVPDAVNDLFWPAEKITELDQACFGGYLAGLREAGWAGRDSEARLGMVASCVKYAWLLPLDLERAANEQHGAYHQPAESAALYRSRGMSLAFLTGWLDEALTLAGQAG